MTDKEKSLRIEINNSIDKIINGVVHPHTERENLAQEIVKLFAIPDVSNRTCVTCLYCQANPSSEFMHDRHKCTLTKNIVTIPMQ